MKRKKKPIMVGISISAIVALLALGLLYCVGNWKKDAQGFVPISELTIPEEFTTRVYPGGFGIVDAERAESAHLAIQRAFGDSQLVPESYENSDALAVVFHDVFLAYLRNNQLSYPVITAVDLVEYPASLMNNITELDEQKALNMQESHSPFALKLGCYDGSEYIVVLTLPFSDTRIEAVFLDGEMVFYNQIL